MILIRDAHEDRTDVPDEIIRARYIEIYLMRWYMYSPCQVHGWLDVHLIISVMEERFDPAHMDEYLFPA